MKRNKQEKNQRDLFYGGKKVASYSLNRESGFAWINIKKGISIEDAANAAHLFSAQHKITIKMNINGAQINIPYNKRTTSKQIENRCNRACRQRERGN